MSLLNINKMERRYPQYNSLAVVIAQILGSGAMTYGLYLATPPQWGAPGKFLLASGGLCVFLWSVDVLMDFLKHKRVN